MNDKPLIILTFILFLVSFIAIFLIQIKYIPASIFLICVLITVSYSIIYFKDRKRMKKLDKATIGIFWANFAFTVFIINIIVAYVGLLTPSSKEFILTAPVPKEYQWIELKSIPFKHKNNLP